MANTSLGGSAFCPFFIKDDIKGGCTICCEGIYGKTTKVCFSDKSSKKHTPKNIVRQ